MHWLLSAKTEGKKKSGRTDRRRIVIVLCGQHYLRGSSAAFHCPDVSTGLCNDRMSVRCLSQHIVFDSSEDETGQQPRRRVDTTAAGMYERLV